MISLSSLASRLRRAPPKRPTTEASRFHLARDRAGLPERDPGPEAVIHAAIDWLRMAQDHSASRDEGVARDFSLETGWATSYPETTGYIVPTMLAYARRYGDPDARRRAASMLDWLVGIQLPGGGFQGGRIDSVPVVPVTFNTGQILLGLARRRVRRPLSRGDRGGGVLARRIAGSRRLLAPASHAVRRVGREGLRNARFMGPVRGRACPGPQGARRSGARQRALGADQAA
jgi:hypothetical protein